MNAFDVGAMAHRLAVGVLVVGFTLLFACGGPSEEPGGGVVEEEAAVEEFAPAEAFAPAEEAAPDEEAAADPEGATTP